MDTNAYDLLAAECKKLGLACDITNEEKGLVSVTWNGTENVFCLTLSGDDLVSALASGVDDIKSSRIFYPPDASESHIADADAACDAFKNLLSAIQLEAK